MEEAAERTGEERKDGERGRVGRGSRTICLRAGTNCGGKQEERSRS